MGTLLRVAAIALTLSINVNAQTLASDSQRRGAFQHYRAGQEYLAAEQFQKAAVEFRAAIGYVRLLTDAHYGLGQSLMGMERYVSAAQAFDACIEAARTLHGLREKDRVAFDRAIEEEIRELRDSVRRVASGQLRVAQPQIKVTQLEQRIQELQSSRSSHGGHFEPPATVLLSLGSAHFRNGDRSNAEKYWSDAVRINDKLGEAWNNLTVVYLRSGRKREAESALRQAEQAGFRVNPLLKDDVKAMP